MPSPFQVTEHKTNIKKSKKPRLLFILITVLMSLFIICFSQENNLIGKISATDTEFTKESQPIAPRSECCTDKINIKAKNVYLWNADTNQILFKKNYDKKISPASTVKMLTAITVLEYCDLEEQIIVGDEVLLIGEDSSVAGLQSGDQLSVKQLLHCLLLPSGNDSAYALAAYTGRKIAHQNISIEDAIQTFVTAMNNESHNIGITDSHFTTPDGFDARGQYTTAQDLAKIAKIFLESDELRQIVKSYRIHDVWSDGKSVTYDNTNELINPNSHYYYPNAIGLKTGRSKNAGSCLVSAAYINKELFICIVMNSSDTGRWQDSLKLYDSIPNQ